MVLRRLLAVVVILFLGPAAGAAAGERVCGKVSRVTDKYAEVVLPSEQDYRLLEWISPSRSGTAVFRNPEVAVYVRFGGNVERELAIAAFTSGAKYCVEDTDGKLYIEDVITSIER